MAYLRAGRIDEAEEMLDQIRPSALAEAARDPPGETTEDPQRVGRAADSRAA